MDKKPKILAIVGPTASGKSDLAVELARGLNGEVISADSRQVYRGMDIGTGKITKREMRGIVHHLLDVASPKRTYTVAQYKRDATRAIHSILRRGKLPILCGGTGFYIQAIVDDLTLPDVKPNRELRKKLATMTTAELFLRLKKLDPKRAASIDAKNPRRLVRAIEIAEALGNVPSLTKESPYNVLEIGIEVGQEKLRERIHLRLKKRMKAGMLKEVMHLHEAGLSWRKMEDLGLEYRYLARFLQEKISKTEMLTELETEIIHYAKRQYTWFRKDKRVKWIGLGDTSTAENLARQFLASNHK